MAGSLENRGKLRELIDKFKVYDVEEGKVVHSEVVNTKGSFL